MDSNTGHQIKHRIYANDEFMTPPELAKLLVDKVPLRSNSTVLDPCPGAGAFIDSFPSTVRAIGLAPDEDFLEFDLPVDYIITNPPYSNLNEWLKHSFELADYGVALLLGLHNITPARMELANHYKFGLVSIHLSKVYHWFGISAFCVWIKNTPDIVGYDRVVWR